MMILFSTDGASPQFFAGLGSPWRITTDISFATKVSDSNRELYRRGLEKYTKITWQAAPLNELLPKKFFSCSKCAISWSHEELMCAIDMAEDLVAYGPKDFGIPIGSPLHNPTERQAFINAIKSPAQCHSCGDLFCSDHKHNTRGKGANLCKPCYKKQKIEERKTREGRR
jgi:hypothetical protein